MSRFNTIEQQATMSEKNVYQMLVKRDFLLLSPPGKARAVTTIFDPLLKPTKL